MKRKYDIGNGWIIEDNGHSLRAEFHDADGKFSKSCGVRRPRLEPVPDQVDVVMSLGGKHFYLHDFASPGLWLGTEKWPTLELMRSQQVPGIMGKEGASFRESPDSQTYFREVMHFCMWSVKSRPDHAKMPKTDDMVLDYLALAQNEDRSRENHFNEYIASSGRTLEWIINKIGPWVKEPPEPAPTVLTD